MARPLKWYVVYAFGQQAKVVRGLRVARAYDGRVPFDTEDTANESAARWNARREVDRVLAEEQHAWRAYERALA